MIGLSRMWHCELCGKVFQHRLACIQHRRLHFLYQPYHCGVGICSRSFPSLSKLQEHRRSHCDYRPHKCKICSVRFLSRRHLRHHRCRINKVRLHQCYICRTSFLQILSLSHHIRTKHFKRRKIVHKVVKEGIEVKKVEKEKPVGLINQLKELRRKQGLLQETNKFDKDGNKILLKIKAGTSTTIISPAKQSSQNSKSHREKKKSRKKHKKSDKDKSNDDRKIGIILSIKAVNCGKEKKLSVVKSVKPEQKNGMLKRVIEPVDTANSLKLKIKTLPEKVCSPRNLVTKGKVSKTEKMTEVKSSPARRSENASPIICDTESKVRNGIVIHKDKTGKLLAEQLQTVKKARKKDRENVFDSFNDIGMWKVMPSPRTNSPIEVLKLRLSPQKPLRLDSGLDTSFESAKYLDISLKAKLDTLGDLSDVFQTSPNTDKESENGIHNVNDSGIEVLSSSSCNRSNGNSVRSVIMDESSPTYFHTEDSMLSFDSPLGDLNKTEHTICHKCGGVIIEPNNNTYSPGNCRCMVSNPTSPFQTPVSPIKSSITAIDHLKSNTSCTNGEQIHFTDIKSTSVESKVLFPSVDKWTKDQNTEKNCSEDHSESGDSDVIIIAVDPFTKVKSKQDKCTDSQDDSSSKRVDKLKLKLKRGSSASPSNKQKTDRKSEERNIYKSKKLSTSQIDKEDTSDKKLYSLGDKQFDKLGEKMLEKKVEIKSEKEKGPQSKTVSSVPLISPIIVIEDDEETKCKNNAKEIKTVRLEEKIVVKKKPLFKSKKADTSKREAIVEKAKINQPLAKVVVESDSAQSEEIKSVNKKPLFKKRASIDEVNSMTGVKNKKPIFKKRSISHDNNKIVDSEKQKPLVIEINNDPKTTANHNLVKPEKEFEGDMLKKSSSKVCKENNNLIKDVIRSLMTKETSLNSSQNIKIKNDKVEKVNDNKKLNEKRISAEHKKVDKKETDSIEKKNNSRDENTEKRNLRARTDLSKNNNKESGNVDTKKNENKLSKRKDTKKRLSENKPIEEVKSKKACIVAETKNNSDIKMEDSVSSKTDTIGKETREQLKEDIPYICKDNNSNKLDDEIKNKNINSKANEIDRENKIDEQHLNSEKKRNRESTNKLKKVTGVALVSTEDDSLQSFPTLEDEPPILVPAKTAKTSTSSPLDLFQQQFLSFLSGAPVKEKSPKTNEANLETSETSANETVSASLKNSDVIENKGEIDNESNLNNTKQVKKEESQTVEKKTDSMSWLKIFSSGSKDEAKPGLIGDTGEDEIIEFNEDLALINKKMDISDQEDNSLDVDDVFDSGHLSSLQPKESLSLTQSGKMIIPNDFTNHNLENTDNQMKRKPGRPQTAKRTIGRPQKPKEPQKFTRPQKAKRSNPKLSENIYSSREKHHEIDSDSEYSCSSSNAETMDLISCDGNHVADSDPDFNPFNDSDDDFVKAKPVRRRDSIGRRSKQRFSKEVSVSDNESLGTIEDGQESLNSRSKRTKKGRKSCCPCCLGSPRKANRDHHTHRRDKYKLPKHHKQFVRNTCRLLRLQEKIHSLFLTLFPECSDLIQKSKVGTEEFELLMDDVLYGLETQDVTFEPKPEMTYETSLAASNTAPHHCSSNSGRERLQNDVSKLGVEHLTMNTNNDFLNGTATTLNCNKTHLSSISHNTDLDVTGPTNEHPNHTHNCLENSQTSGSLNCDNFIQNTTSLFNQGTKNPSPTFSDLNHPLIKELESNVSNKVNAFTEDRIQSNGLDDKFHTLPLTIDTGSAISGISSSQELSNSQVDFTSMNHNSLHMTSPIEGAADSVESDLVITIDLLAARVSVCRDPKDCIEKIHHSLIKLSRYLLPKLSFKNYFYKNVDNLEFLLDLMINANAGPCKLDESSDSETEVLDSIGLNVLKTMDDNIYSIGQIDYKVLESETKSAENNKHEMMLDNTIKVIDNLDEIVQVNPPMDEDLETNTIKSGIINCDERTPVFSKYQEMFEQQIKSHKESLKKDVFVEFEIVEEVEDTHTMLKSSEEVIESLNKIAKRKTRTRSRDTRLRKRTSDEKRTLFVQEKIQNNYNSTIVCHSQESLSPIKKRTLSPIKTKKGNKSKHPKNPKNIFLSGLSLGDREKTNEQNSTKESEMEECNDSSYVEDLKTSGDTGGHDDKTPDDTDGELIQASVDSDAEFNVKDTNDVDSENRRKSGDKNIFELMQPSQVIDTPS